MTEVTEAERRAERRAEIAAGRREDATLDLPILQEIVTAAEGIDLTALQSLTAEILNPRIAGGAGASLSIEVSNLMVTLTNMKTIAAALVSEAEAVLNETQPD